MGSVTITLTGANDFARKAELGAIFAAFLADNDAMAVERLDGDDASAERLQEAVASLPFLTDRKLVILREPGKQKAWAEHIAEILPNIADTTDVIIVEPKLDKRLSYYKTLKKSTDFREFSELDAFGLAAWAVQYVKQQGGGLASGDAKSLVDCLGNNQQLLKSELDKLLAYSPQITGQTIGLLVEPMPQSTVFELLDAAFQGQTAKAMQLYREQRALKVEPQAIIAMLAWQLHALAVVKAAGSRPADDIARDAKLNPFVVRKTAALARNLSLAQLRGFVKQLLELDIKTKTVSIDADEALQFYLLKLAM